MKDIFIPDTETLYKDFKQIPSQSFREKIRYVDYRKDLIDQLSFAYMIDIKISYVFALFEIGSYERFLEKADEIIEQVIMHNIYYHDHQDVYSELLFRKAASLYNLGALDEAILIIDQIISINHEHKFAPAFLQKCLTLQRRHRRSWMQAVGIMLLLAGVGFIALEVLVVKPFFPNLITTANSFRTALLIPGVAVLVWAEIYNRLSVKILVIEKVRKSYSKTRSKK
jgi:tetratricopeptide (TPR) repeat protein